jgi:Lantibiotic dehydratase, N terminus
MMAARFRCVDAAVIRVAVQGGELELPPWPDLTGNSPEHVREWRRWLRLVWQQDALVEAIEVASPVLARRVEDVCGGGVRQLRRVRRVVESVVRYLLRMMSRATPFGLFAGGLRCTSAPPLSLLNAESCCRHVPAVGDYTTFGWGCHRQRQLTCRLVSWWPA